MKHFEVKVQNSKVDFFIELLKQFEFLEFKEVEPVSEPRVYPGGKFEIRGKDKSESKPEMRPEAKKAIFSADPGLASIRKVMDEIERQRNISSKSR